MGRCYLVAPEHFRNMAPVEICNTKPLIRQGLEELRKASKAEDFIDISNQEVTATELSRAASQPAGDDHSAEPPLEQVVLPPVVATAQPVEPLTVMEQPVEEVDMKTERVYNKSSTHTWKNLEN